MIRNTSIRRLDDFDEEDDEESMLPEVENSEEGFKSTVWIQFEPIMKGFILMGIYVCAISSIVDYTFVISTDREKYQVPDLLNARLMKIFYTVDVFFITDVILMILFRRSANMEIRENRHKSRHPLIILVEIISIVPLEFTYYHMSSPEMSKFALLRLRYVLRVIRFLFGFNKKSTKVEHIAIQLFKVLANIYVSVLSVACIYYVNICNAKKCDYAEWDTLQAICFKLISSITGINWNITIPYQNLYGKYLTAAVVLFGYLTCIYVKCHMTCICVERMVRRAIFLIKKNRDMGLLKMHKEKDELVKKTMNNYYEIEWKKTQGSVTKRDSIQRQHLPAIMTDEIFLDISWNALKHSHLFRDESVDFLRYISQLAKLQYLHEGEVIYRRGSMKEYMVYIMTGNVHILSDLNGETPILSFGGGTILGESSLYLTNSPNNTCVCQCYCQLLVLYREDYIKIIHKYPEIYRKLQRRIMNRLEKTRNMHKVALYYNKIHNIQIPKSALSLKYLKYTITKILDKVDVKTVLDRTWSLDYSHFQVALSKTGYCADYLDMYVLCSDTEMETDPDLEMGMPTTVHPDSMLLVVWEQNIITTCIFFYFFLSAFIFLPIGKYNYILTIGITYVTIIWIVDILIQCSTLVVTKDVVSTQHSSIFFECIRRFTFYLDIGAALPIEVFCNYLDGNLEPRIKILFYLNRLLKTYRVYSFFNHDNTNTVTSLNVKQAFKYFAYLISIIFGMMCIHTYQKNISETELTVHYMIKEFNTIVSFFTSQTFGKPLPGDTKNLAILFQAVIFLYMIYVIAMISASTTMQMKVYLRFHEIMDNAFWTTKGLNRTLQKRVRKHLKVNSMIGQGIYLIDNKQCFSDLTPNLRSFCERSIYYKYMKDTRFLRNLPEELIVQLFSVSEQTFIPPGEIIFYADEAATEIHIIKKGFCRVVNNSKYKPLYRPGRSLNVIESFMETTSVNTVQSVTTITTIVLPFERIKKVLNHYDTRILKQIKQSMFEAGEIDEVRTFSAPQTKVKKDKHRHYFLNRRDKYYYRGFPKQYKLVKNLLLRVTFTPYGDIVFGWEIGRSVVAIISIYLNAVPITFICGGCPEMILQSICDCLLLVDIYFQHHICYFNSKAFLIYHPFKTASHYWRYSFCMDFLTFLPLDWFYLMVKGKSADNYLLSLLRLNRYLQLYRIVKLSNYIRDRFDFYRKIIMIIRWCILTILTIHILSGLYILNHCTFNENIKAAGIFSDGITCDESIFEQVKSPVDNVVTPYFISMIGFYCVTLVLSNRSIEVLIVNENKFLMVSIISLLGLITHIVILSIFIANSLFSNSDLILYQTRMKNLVYYMSDRVGKTVKKEVIDHSEYNWKKTKGHNLRDVVQYFNNSLRIDCLYGVYGKVFKSSGIFPNTSKPFIKSFMVHLSHEYYQNCGIICKVNNIHGVIYIIYKGTVDVLGPDYNRLLTLPVGSIFGNLDNTPMVRQTLTMVAKGNVEVLSIPSVTFHNVLSKYPTYLKKFRQHTIFHVDYIEANPAEKTKSNSISYSSHSKGRLNCSDYFTRIRGRTKFIEIWESIIINIFYFLSFFAEAFAVITYSENIYLNTTLYVFDVIACFNMYLKFHTAIKNEYGFIVKERSMISKNYLTSIFGFYFELAATMPFDLLAFIFFQKPYFYQIFHLARSNRFLRFGLVFVAVHQDKQKLNVNVHILRILSSFLWLLAYSQFSAILIATIIRPNFPNSHNNTSIATEFEYYMSTNLDVLKISTSTKFDYSLLSNVNIYTLGVTSMLVMLQRLVVEVVFTSQICATMQILRNNKTLYTRYITWLQKTLLSENVSLPLYKRIMKYLELLWMYQNGTQFPNLLNEAPYYIREAVLNSIFGYHLREHYILKGCHVDLLRQMAAALRSTFYFPGDFICFVGDIDECMYVIHEGKVVALTQDTLQREVVYRYLFKGEIFGIKQAMYPKIGHDYSYKAIEYTVILHLKRSDFICLLKFFPASKYIIYDSIRVTQRYMHL